MLRLEYAKDAPKGKKRIKIEDIRLTEGKDKDRLEGILGTRFKKI